MIEALGDATILSMLVCIGLALVAYRTRMLPVMVVSSLGWIIIGLQIYENLESLLALALIFMLAISQIFMVVKN